MLNFIGIGSAFNTPLGNTSAYIKEGNSLLLIDCGGMIFNRIQEKDLLNDVKDINILITHTHPDHIGSLGDLIFYSYYIMGIRPSIFFPAEELLRSLLNGFGVDPLIYDLDSRKSFAIGSGAFSSYQIDYKPSLHIDDFPAFGFYINSGEETIYYSGDTYVLEDEVVTRLKNNQIQKLYHDTSGLDHENNRHYAFTKLEAKIPQELRSKVYCMHFDKHADFEKIRSSGFNIVQIAE